MPVLMVKTYIVMFSVDERCDMKSGYGLHDVARAALNSAWPKMGTNNKSTPFVRAAWTIASVV